VFLSSNETSRNENYNIGISDSNSPSSVRTASATKGNQTFRVRAFTN
jgi:hypothetical protein